MPEYLTILDIISIITLIIMAILVHENNRHDRKTKLKFYLTCLSIFAAMFAEWAGLYLNHSSGNTYVLHSVMKCLDYTMTPVAGYMVIGQVAKQEKVQRILGIILLFNLILQVLSIFNGWTFYIDADNVYHRGPFYTLYILICVLTLFCVFINFYVYGKNYSRKNRGSLFSICFFVVFGILVQELLDYRICYLVLSVSAVMIFIHYSEFSQIVNDADLKRHKKMLETDVLTGMYSRYAYTDELDELKTGSGLPEDLVVFSVDINALKEVNDTLGHLAGDELIQGAADCIRTVLGRYGKCYRTGGDEFISILYMNPEEAFDLCVRLNEEAGEWSGRMVDSLSLSVGYAASVQTMGIGIEELIHLADEKMYDAKEQYYMQGNRNRRRNKSQMEDSLHQKQNEYADIISAFASDVSGLYVVDRLKSEVTVYRMSEMDHRIRSGVPLEEGFETAMERFIDKHVHPDDKDSMRMIIRMESIERELKSKKSFIYHFRTLKGGEIRYHYMKCIRNIPEDDYDKLIISFCPEDNLAVRRKVQELVDTGISTRNSAVLIVSDREKDQTELSEILKEEYDCRIAKDGMQAMEMMKEHYSEISVVLYRRTIAQMPVGEFMKILNKDLLLSTIPVIVTADFMDEKMEEFCLEMGVVDSFVRPYHSAQIRKRIRNIIKLNELGLLVDEIEIDDLTGLYTRQAFLYHAKTLIDASPDESFTVVITDILNFRIFNGSYGEHRGDELLKLAAGYMRKTVHTGICARYGADQFIAIVKTPKKEFSFYTEKMQAYINQNCPENVVLKFGIYENIDRNLEMTRICDRALLALKSTKTSFECSYSIFDGPISQQHLRAQVYETNFRKAIEKHEFIVWYQPKYNAYTGKVIGAEALVRWQTQDGRMIPPSEFLPVFENDGLIRELDEYVFRAVCRQLKKWKKQGRQLIPISVNLSRYSMNRSDIVKRYKEIIEDCGIQPFFVPIEITESAAIGNVEIKPLADAFYEAGFPLHMDDFGSGKSSIAGLNLLHFDTVKLDKSLIEFIGQREGNLVLMYTVALGSELGMRLVAEGVETGEQVEYLKDIGCEGIQGYYYSKPFPIEEFEKRTVDLLADPNDLNTFGYKLTAADSVVKRAMDRMLQRMPGGFFTYRYDNKRILSSNSYLWNLFGCRSEDEFMEYVGGTFSGIVCPEDLDTVEAFIQTQIQGDQNEMDYVEYHICRKDGRKIRVADYGHLDHQSDGDIFYVFISEIRE